MIRNAFEMLCRRDWKTLPAFFKERRTSQASPRDVQPDIRWDDASVGIFICGMGRGVYVHPLNDRVQSNLRPGLSQIFSVTGR